MVTAVYPFWSGVAVQVGRLLRHQGPAAAAHIQRRVREQYGEREPVSRAARRVLRSYLDWGVLQETDTKGIYTSGKPQSVSISTQAYTCRGSGRCFTQTRHPTSRVGRRLSHAAEAICRGRRKLTVAKLAFQAQP